MRFLTLNLWNEQGDPEARLRLCAERLRALAPDAIALQEVRERAGVHQAATLAAALGARFVFAPVAEWGGGVEGLALLSPHPILEEAAFDLPDPGGLGPRRLLRARVRGPEGDVVVGCTHLCWQLSAGLTREAQVVAGDERMREAEGVRVWMGDFNAPPDADEIRFLAGRATLAGRRTAWQDAFARARPCAAGWTWARRNPNTAAMPHVEIDRRIDYVWVSPAARDGRGEVLSADVALDAPDREGRCCSDHFAVVADVRVAPR